MVKKVVIAGCRDYTNYQEAKKYIDMFLSKIKNEYEIVIISGGANGADSIGERYAMENGFKVEIFPAEWDKYGKSAGPIRNEKMAKASDFAICFWDGKSRGTASMISCAKSEGKALRVVYIK